MDTLKNARKALNINNRAHTLQGFDVLQLTHYHNINGAKIMGLFNKGDTAQWPFVLKFKAKHGPDVGFTYTMGKHLAHKILEIAKQNPIACFDPLKATTITKETRNNDGTEKKKFTDLNEELHKAINIFLIAKKIKEPKGLFFDLLSELRSYPSRDRHPEKIIRFNKALQSKEWKPSPLGLQDVMQQLRKEHPSLQSYNFPLMERLLAEKGETSFLGATPIPLTDTPNEKPQNPSIKSQFLCLEALQKVT